MGANCNRPRIDAEDYSDLGPKDYSNAEGKPELTPGRSRLVVENRPLVVAVVRGMVRRSEFGGDPADMAADGTLGLIEAAIGFDPDRGVKFATYAPFIIRGRIVDGLRAMMPNGARRPEQLAKFERTPKTKSIESLLSRPNDNKYDTDKDFSLLAMMASDADPLAEARDYHETLDDLFKGLVPRHRRMMTLLYGHAGMTMKAAGKALGLSESRVSQMHSYAIDVIRERHGLPPRDTRPGVLPMDLARREVAPIREAS